MLHVAIDMGWKISFLLGVIEDGGEMLVVTIAACYLFVVGEYDGDVGKLLLGKAHEPQ